MGITIDTVEVPVVRNAHQLPSTVVAPTVIRADEAAFHVTASPGDVCPPMAADVQEGTHITVAATHHQNRDAAGVVGEIVAGFWNPAGEPHHQWIAAKQNLHLAIQPMGIRVVGGGIRGHIVREAGGTGIDVLEQFVRQLYLQRVFHDSSGRRTRRLAP